MLYLDLTEGVTSYLSLFSVRVSLLSLSARFACSTTEEERAALVSAPRFCDPHLEVEVARSPPPRLVVVACTSSHSPALFQPNRFRGPTDPSCSPSWPSCCVYFAPVSERLRPRGAGVDPSEPAAFHALYIARRPPVVPASEYFT